MILLQDMSTQTEKRIPRIAGVIPNAQQSPQERRCIPRIAGVILGGKMERSVSTRIPRIAGVIPLEEIIDEQD